MGCSGDATSPQPNPERDLPGTWTAPFVIAGSGESWTLSLSGTDITGTGTWSGEACCSGTVAVSGVLRGDSLHLDLLYVETSPTASRPPSSAHIDGVLDTPTDLVGITQSADGTTEPAHYVKQPR